MKDSHTNYQKETQATDDYKDIEFLQWLSFFLLIVLIPSSIWLWKKFHQKPASKPFDCNCESCDKKHKEKVKIQNDEVKSKSNKFKLYFVIFLWIVFAVLMFKVVTSNHEVEEPYNPYKILGVEIGASEADIKKAHKTLSKVYHPDKNDGNDEKYMEIAKAYKTLTDVATREKWEKYGNPDGPQRMSVGIALPSWLINKNNSPVVLTAYLLLLVVALPTAVFYWNKSTRSKVPPPPEQQTMALFYHCIGDDIDLKQMIEVLAASTEYKAALPDRKEDEGNLRAIYQKIPDQYRLSYPLFNASYIVKGTILLLAHITRVTKDMPSSLKTDLEEILKSYRRFLTGAFTLTREKRQLVGLVESVHIAQCIMQAAWPDQTLKQLPHVDNTVMASLKSNGVNDISKFKIHTDQDKRKELLQKASLGDRQIKDVENILEKIPCQVGVKYKISSDSPVLLSSSVCILEIEFTDQILIKQQKQEESITSNSSNNNNHKDNKKAGTIKKRNVNKKQSGADEKAVEQEKSENEEEEVEVSKKSKKSTKKEKKVADDEFGQDNDEENEDEDSDDEDFDSEYSDSDDDDDTWEKTPKKSLIMANKEIYHTPLEFDDKPVSFFIILGIKSKNEMVAFGKTDNFAPGQTMKIPFLSNDSVGPCHYTLYVLCDGYLGCDIVQEINVPLAFNPKPLRVQRPVLPPQKPPPRQKQAAQQRNAQQQQRPVQPQPQPQPQPITQQQPQPAAAQPQPAAAQPQPAAAQPQPAAALQPPQPKPLTQKQINQQQKQAKKQMKAQSSSSSSTNSTPQKATITELD